MEACFYAQLSQFDDVGTKTVGVQIFIYTPIG